MISSLKVYDKGAVMMETSKTIEKEKVQLKPCPNSPNCVSTQEEDSSKKMEPLRYNGSKQEAIKKLENIINDTKRTEIKKKTENYLHAEFKTALLRFTDDVEFSIDEKQKLIHFRSASRVGYSDFGVNRKRMKDIQTRFYKDE
jgi:uncharacterized protein (DUF1499 family)